MSNLKTQHKRLYEYYMVNELPDDEHDDVGWFEYRSLLDDFGKAADEIERLKARIEKFEVWGGNVLSTLRSFDKDEANALEQVFCALAEESDE